MLGSAGVENIDVEGGAVVAVDVVEATLGGKVGVGGVTLKVGAVDSLFVVPVPRRPEDGKAGGPVAAGGALGSRPGAPGFWKVPDGESAGLAGEGSGSDAGFVAGSVAGTAWKAGFVALARPENGEALFAAGAGTEIVVPKGDLVSVGAADGGLTAACPKGLEAGTLDAPGNEGAGV
jgi:hypothetical protein